MPFNFSALAGLFAREFYGDLLTVYRRGEYKDDYGATQFTQAQAVMVDVPCRISRQSLDPSRAQELPLNESEYVFTLFCHPSTDLRKGDRVTVTRRAGGTPQQEYDNVILGQPRNSDYHLQVECYRKETA